MNLKLPKRKDKDELLIEEVKKVVLIGANGSGKTRIGAWIEKNNSDNVLRISAQKSLNFPEYVMPKAYEHAFDEYFYGYHFKDEYSTRANKFNHRWNQNENTSLLNDYEKLLVLLHTEEYEESVKYKDASKNDKELMPPNTSLDKIKELWEELLPHRRLIKKAGCIEAHPTNRVDNNYNAVNMSDGERLILYLIGSVLVAPKDSIIIIDEPENHLHRAIIKKLWDKLEVYRKDCVFIYITHDLEFAVSRAECRYIWVKEYYGNDIWEYEELESVTSIPQELYFELLGSRKDIIFVEGKNESYDLNIYENIFKSYTIKPLGSCSKVIEATKAFNDLKQFHNISAYGIIDRDRRSQEEVNGYERKGIYTPKVAEVDNFFMIEDVIKLMCRIKRKDEEDVFNTIKDNVFNIFIREKETQVKELSIYQIKEKIRNLIVDNESKETFNEFVDNLKVDLNSFNYSEIYSNNESVLNNIIESRNYEELIKIFNYKAIIGESQILSLCEFKNKKAYIEFVLTIVKENSIDGEVLRNAFGKYVEIGSNY